MRERGYTERAADNQVRQTETSVLNGLIFFYFIDRVISIKYLFTSYEKTFMFCKCDGGTDFTHLG